MTDVLIFFLFFYLLLISVIGFGFIFQNTVLGKIVNFDDQKIIENFKSVFEVIEKEKPAGIKGNYIKNIFFLRHI